MRHIFTCILLMLFSSVFAQKEVDALLLKEVCRYNKSDSLKISLLDSASNTKEFPSVFYKIEGNSKHIIAKYAYYGRVNTCRSGGCSKPQQNSIYSSEYFDYIILFDSMARIKHIRITDYQATHGQQITAKSWLRQFYDYSADNQEFPGVDAISGATISVNAASSDILLRSEEIKKLIGN